MKLRAIDKLYPEIKAGGFTKLDQKVEFFNRINALLTQDAVVLDFGAGRGEWADGHDAYRIELQDFKKNPKVSKVIGVDVDPVVKTNPYMDETHVFEPGKPLPLADNSVDIISSFAVFEHVEDPELIISELSRVLKPGGWICAWTPNKLGYIALVASIIPNSFHTSFLRRLGLVSEEKGQRGAEDVFPTFYRLNTIGAVSKAFTKHGFSNYSYIFSNSEVYAGPSLIIAYMLKFYNWILPPSFGTHLFIFLHKDKES